MGKIINFFKEVWVELGRVVWPTRAETIKYTTQVIVFCLVVAVILGAADLGLIELLQWVLTK